MMGAIVYQERHWGLTPCPAAPGPNKEDQALRISPTCATVGRFPDDHWEDASRQTVGQNSLRPTPRKWPYKQETKQITHPFKTLVMVSSGPTGSQ